MPSFKYSEQSKLLARATQQTNAKTFLEDVFGTITVDSGFQMTITVTP
jgi:hypothetical protein